MMISCQPDAHRLEFVECKHGVIEYRCKHCGETISEYQDCEGA